MASTQLLPPASEADSPVPVEIARSAPFINAARRVFSSYAFRTIFQGIITIWAVMTFTFVMIRQMPGNPFEVYVSQILMTENVSYEEAMARAAGLFDFDPDAPLLEQYIDYLGKIIRGDLGQSITSAGTPVAQQILRYLPWTLFSVGSGLLISFTLGILIGTAMAFWRGTVFDNVMTALSSILFSIPNYIVAARRG
jgi:peptide/nickel transport system permease protein